MWCPSVSLSVWANAWLAGCAAPDDVLDALSDWAPKHSVIAYDAVAAGRTGLPWPDVNEAGVMSLLQTVRSAAGRRSADSLPGRTAITLLLPVPGDVRGLAPGTQFAADALAAGEAVVVSSTDGQAIGLVPAIEYEGEDDAPGEAPGQAPEDSEGPIGPGVLSWSVYSIPAGPVPEQLDLGEAEYALRSAVRSAAEVLGTLRLAGGGGDPRALVEEIMGANSHHRVPDHAPTRALRVLSTAAHVDAIITVGSDLTTIGTQSSSEARIADSALRPLASVVRAARSAAVSAILQSAWQR